MHHVSQESTITQAQYPPGGRQQWTATVFPTRFTCFLIVPVSPFSATSVELVSQPDSSFQRGSSNLRPTRSSLSLSQKAAILSLQ